MPNDRVAGAPQVQARRPARPPQPRRRPSTAVSKRASGPSAVERGGGGHQLLHRGRHPRLRGRCHLNTVRPVPPSYDPGARGAARGAHLARQRCAQRAGIATAAAAAGAMVTGQTISVRSQRRDPARAGPRRPRPACGCGARALQHARDVGAHGPLGDPEPRGDLSVVEALDDQLQHLALPGGERRAVRRRGRAPVALLIATDSSARVQFFASRARAPELRGGERVRRARRARRARSPARRRRARARAARRAAATPGSRHLHRAACAGAARRRAPPRPAPRGSRAARRARSRTGRGARARAGRCLPDGCRLPGDGGEVVEDADAAPA